MLVLALDPGIAHLGFALGHITKTSMKPIQVGLFETDASKVKCRKSDDDLRRISLVMRRISRLIALRRPEAIASEVPHMGAKSASAQKYLALATSLIAYIEVAHGYDVMRFTPNEVKKTWTGDPHAKKEQMIEKALQKYGTLKGWPRKPNGELYSNAVLEHPADAIAVMHAAQQRLGNSHE